MSAIESICRHLESEQVSFAAEDRADHATDWGTAVEDGVEPAVVIWPESTADVTIVLEEANCHGVPVTPFAAGTSLEGNPVPVAGGISLDMSRMNEVHTIRPDDLQVDVGPGIYGHELNAALEEYGLVLPALPASGRISTVGGMVANDASGMETVKYGEVGDWVLEIEAVLPTGEVLTAGSKAMKTSSGYNLRDLLIGSEGTLAVMTELTFRLTSQPQQVRSGRATFHTLEAAAAAISETIRSGVDVAKIELVDAESAAIANASLGTELPHSPLVFLEFQGSSVETAVERCRDIFESNGVTQFAIATEAEAMAALWEARTDFANAVRDYDPALTSLTPGDVTVPISRFPELITHIKTLGEQQDLHIPCFGHAGDGNVHYFVLFDGDEPARVQDAKTVSKRIVDRAIELGGTATGEHGVGVGKRESLVPEHGAVAVETMQSIKEVFDPNGILNPGKVFPEPSRGAESEPER